ncbi:MAG: PhzF family phenazine biosynthesis protein [Gemmatimonadales bacterium]
MPYKYHTTDVFSDTPFAGNQLAVVPDARGLSDAQMATIAREFNYSETIFFLPPANPANTCSVRIFTPGSELPFAGHPTVGGAMVMAMTGEIELTGAETRIVLEEGVGPVPVMIRSENGKPVFAQLTTGKLPEKGDESHDARDIARIISLDIRDIDTEGDAAIEPWSAGVPYLIVPLKSLDALGRSRINFDLWEKKLKGCWAPETYLFVETDESRARDGIRNGNGEIRTRMYAPALGIPEDPATGSAVASLAGYLAARSSIRDGMLRYTIHQGVEMGRASRMELEVDVANGVVKAVRIGGAAVLIASGTLHVP